MKTEQKKEGLADIVGSFVTAGLVGATAYFAAQVIPDAVVKALQPSLQIGVLFGVPSVYLAKGLYSASMKKDGMGGLKDSCVALGYFIGFCGTAGLINYLQTH